MKCHPNLTNNTDTISILPDTSLEVNLHQGSSVDDGMDTGSEVGDELGDTSQVVGDHTPSHMFR